MNPALPVARHRARRHRRHLALPLIGSVALVAAGCGAGSSAATPDDGVASLGSAVPAATADDAGSPMGEISEAGKQLKAPEDPEQATALYDKCMKDAGYSMPTSTSPGGGVEIEDVFAGTDPAKAAEDVESRLDTWRKSSEYEVNNFREWSGA